MTHGQAVLLGVGTFVAGLLACIALFAALDVQALFLPGPAIGVALAAYGAYRTAAGDAGGGG